MRVLGERVLIEQVMTEKQSKIILPKGAKKEEGFDVTFKVLQVGDEVPAGKMVEGDAPVFSKHVQFDGVKKVEDTATKKIMHVIVHYEDIIAIDNEQ